MSDYATASGRDYAVIIAARNSSERLPNKAIVSYCPDGTPNLAQIIGRWQASRREPIIIVATTDDPRDDSIGAVCAGLSVPCYRAPRATVSVNDVVTRLNNAMVEYAPGAGFVARALADNPLVDVGLADWRLDVLRETGADGLYYGGDESRITYAGTTDVFSRSAWDRIARASVGSDREHPGAHFWNNIGRYSAIQLPLPPREYLAPVRTELDTPEDLEMFRVLWMALRPARYAGLMGQLDALDGIRYLVDHPEVSSINSNVQPKTQSRPSYGRGAAFTCRDCARRTGTVDAGNLVLRCSHCGRPQKFYSKPPMKPSSMRY